MATSDKYKRGSSGYSIEDEKNAKRYGEMTRAQYQSLANEEQAKKRPGALDTAAVLRTRDRAEEIYKDNETSPQGRKANKSNLEYGQSELNKMYKTNSREQYMHEKEQGGPMTDLSYEEWKKL